MGFHKFTLRRINEQLVNYCLLKFCIFAYFPIVILLLESIMGS
jgi:hypothetical protein